MCKNREELIKEIEEFCNERDAALAQAKEADSRIADIENKLNEADAHNCMLEECFNAALQLREMKDCFVKAGFSEKEAFDLIIHMLPGGQQAPTVGSLLGAILG